MPKLGIGLKISKFWHRIIGDKAAKKCYGKMMSISSLPQNINMEHIITIQPHTLNYHICHFMKLKKSIWEIALANSSAVDTSGISSFAIFKLMRYIGTASFFKSTA